MKANKRVVQIEKLISILAAYSSRKEQSNIASHLNGEVGATRINTVPIELPLGHHEIKW